MENNNLEKFSGVFVGLSAIIVVFQIVGGLDLRNAPYNGFLTDKNHKVKKIESGSPAEHAGFMVGDVVASRDGIDSNDTKSRSRQLRAKIGETRSFVIERNGQTMNLELTFSELPTREKMRRYAGATIGLIFIFCGLRAFRKIPTKCSFLLAAVGLCFGFFMMNHPYLTTYELRMIYFSIFPFVILVGVASLLYYMVSFPKTKQLFQKTNAAWIVYAPALLVAVFRLYLNVVQPDGDTAVHRAWDIVIGLFAITFLSATVIAMAHSYFSSSPKERQLYGLNFLLAGTVVGLGPGVITTVGRLISPSVVFPGEEYYFLAMALIPISLMLATLKKETAVQIDNIA